MSRNGRIACGISVASAPVSINKGIPATLLLAMGFLIVTRATGAGGEAKSESYFGTGILNNGFDKPLGQSFVGNANQRIL